MTIPQHYQPDVARKHAELTQHIHRTAWGDLWAQGIVFHSPEMAFHWRARRNELLTFWEPMGDASMCHDLRLELDDYRKQDDALRAAALKSHNQDDDEYPTSDDLYDRWIDEQLMEAGLL